jgi:hypothetical protein
MHMTNRSSRRSGSCVTFICRSNFFIHSSPLQYILMLDTCHAINTSRCQPLSVSSKFNSRKVPAIIKYTRGGPRANKLLEYNSIEPILHTLPISTYRLKPTNSRRSYPYTRHSTWAGKGGIKRCASLPVLPIVEDMHLHYYKLSVITRGFHFQNRIYLLPSISYPMCLVFVLGV